MLTVLVGKKIANSNRFRKGYVKVLNKINGAETISEKVANIEAIKKIQNEKISIIILHLNIKSE